MNVHSICAADGDRVVSFERGSAGCHLHAALPGALGHACDAPAATALREAEPVGGNDTHKMAESYGDSDDA